MWASHSQLPPFPARGSETCLPEAQEAGWFRADSAGGCEGPTESRSTSPIRPNRVDRQTPRPIACSKSMPPAGLNCAIFEFARSQSALHPFCSNVAENPDDREGRPQGERVRTHHAVEPNCWHTQPAKLPNPKFSDAKNQADAFAEVDLLKSLTVLQADSPAHDPYRTQLPGHHVEGLSLSAWEGKTPPS